MQNKCSYIDSETGQECQSFAMESGYCFSHDPELAEEKKLAVQKGGQALKRIRLNLPPVKLRTPQDVIVVLEETLNLVRSGELPCSSPANSIGFLCSHILKAMELNDVGMKLEAIDRVILERKTTGRVK